jgi:hypothetical protein
MIKPCDGARCVSAYQDKRYGKGMRVFNYMAKNGGRRCTVCAKEVAGAVKFAKPAGK